MFSRSPCCHYVAILSSEHVGLRSWYCRAGEGGGTGQRLRPELCPRSQPLSLGASTPFVLGATSSRVWDVLTRAQDKGSSNTSCVFDFRALLFYCPRELCDLWKMGSVHFRAAVKKSLSC